MEEEVLRIYVLYSTSIDNNHNLICENNETIGFFSYYRAEEAAVTKEEEEVLTPYTRSHGTTARGTSDQYYCST